MTKRKPPKRPGVVKPTARELEEMLRRVLYAYEADCHCRKVDPGDVMKNHTWLAIAYTEAQALLGAR